MSNLIARYARWLHTRWPAGSVEKLPEVREDGSTSLPGVFVAGDLTGIPLLKTALDTGARTMQRIALDLSRGASGATGAAANGATDASTGERNPSDPVDVAIIGAGVSGMAAAMEAKRLGLSFIVLESAESFFTIVNFPKRKPIFTYPMRMKPAGELQVSAKVQEELVEELRRQT